MSLCSRLASPQAVWCTDYFLGAERLSVEVGWYEVRVLYANLDKLSEDGLTGEDHYRIELWKGEPKAFEILKQYLSQSWRLKKHRLLNGRWAEYVRRCGEGLKLPRSERLLSAQPRGQRRKL